MIKWSIAHEITLSVKTKSLSKINKYLITFNAYEKNYNNCFYAPPTNTTADTLQST